MLFRRFARFPCMNPDSPDSPDLPDAVLFYAATIRPFPGHCARLRAYFDQLVERPSVLRTIEEAKPYFENYPFEAAIPAGFR